MSRTHQSVWRAKNALQLRYTWFPAMSDLLRFEILQFCLLENLCDVCLWKHRCVKIGNRLKNCSWGQVVTVTGILLSCFLGLCYMKDINSTFLQLVKIGVGLPNCSWGRVVTGAWILLSCVLGLHWTKDTDFIFFSSNFQFFYFHIDE